MKILRKSLGLFLSDSSVARSMRWVLVIIAFLTLWAVFYVDVSLAQTRESPIRVTVIELNGVIDRVSERYLERSIDTANKRGDAVIIIRLDTPGGLLDSTRAMVEAILDSEVPIAVYVSPEGAQAASAGAFIAGAADYLAMSPVTNIGAASPVSSMGQDLGDTLASKVTEDAAAFIRSIAEARGRNVSAYEMMVYNATSYSAEEASDMNISDGVVADIDALLEILGSKWSIAGISSAEISEVKPSFLEIFLGIISNPNISFLLVSLGGIALIVELWNFGSWIPGIAGIFMLAVGFGGIGFLPFSWVGIGLIVLAIILFAAETNSPGFGFFGIAGGVCLVLGGLFLFGFFGGPTLPGVDFRVNRWLLIGVGITSGFFVLWFAAQIRAASKGGAGYINPSSISMLPGLEAEVTVKLSPDGQVFVAGEEWIAEIEGDQAVEVGEHVIISRAEGLRLYVRRPENEERKQDQGVVE